MLILETCAPTNETHPHRRQEQDDRVMAFRWETEKETALACHALDQVGRIKRRSGGNTRQRTQRPPEVESEV